MFSMRRSEVDGTGILHMLVDTVSVFSRTFFFMISSIVSPKNEAYPDTSVVI